MIRGLIVLLTCQLAGEFLVRAVGVPVPGPVVGMVILFVGFTLRSPTPSSPVVTTSDGLLSHLQLLFVPAGAGVIAYLPLIAGAWLPIVGGLVIGWFGALAAAAGAGAGTLHLQRRWASRHAGSGDVR
jgi:holin-like protein